MTEKPTQAEELFLLGLKNFPRGLHQKAKEEAAKQHCTVSKLYQKAIGLYLDEEAVYLAMERRS